MQKGSKFLKNSVQKMGLFVKVQINVELRSQQVPPSHPWQIDKKLIFKFSLIPLLFYFTESGITLPGQNFQGNISLLRKV